MAYNLVIRQKSKHIETYTHFTIGSTKQIVDVFIKQSHMISLLVFAGAQIYIFFKTR